MHMPQRSLCKRILTVMTSASPIVPILLVPYLHPFCRSAAFVARVGFLPFYLTILTVRTIRSGYASSVRAEQAGADLTHIVSAYD